MLLSPLSILLGIDFKDLLLNRVLGGEFGSELAAFAVKAYLLIKVMIGRKGRAIIGKPMLAFLRAGVAGDGPRIGTYFNLVDARRRVKLLHRLILERIGHELA